MWSHHLIIICRRSKEWNYTKSNTIKPRLKNSRGGEMGERRERMDYRDTQGMMRVQTYWWDVLSIVKLILYLWFTNINKRRNFIMRHKKIKNTQSHRNMRSLKSDEPRSSSLQKQERRRQLSITTNISHSIFQHRGQIM